MTFLYISSGKSDQNSANTLEHDESTTKSVAFAGGFRTLRSFFLSDAKNAQNKGAGGAGSSQQCVVNFFLSHGSLNAAHRQLNRA